MTKKKITDQDRRDRIQPILDYWVPALGLSDWQISWEITDELPIKTVGGEPVGANVNIRGPYQTAHIRFVRDSIDNNPLNDELEPVVIHELGHCVLHPILVALERSVGDQSDIYSDVHWEVEKLLDSLAALLLGMKNGKPLTALYSPLIRS